MRFRYEISDALVKLKKKKKEKCRRKNVQAIIDAYRS